MPRLIIRCEDSIAQEVIPVFMKRHALPVVLELSSQNGLDVLGVSCKDAAKSGRGPFDRLAEILVIFEPALPRFKVLMVYGTTDRSDNYIDAWDR